MDRTNKHLHLLDKIKNLNVSLIENMSSDVMAMVTDCFDESLVRNVVYVGKTNMEQRKIIKKIKDDYKHWKEETDFMWRNSMSETYPKHIEDLQLDIECGMLVTIDGSIPEPQLEPFIMHSVLGDSLRQLKGLSNVAADDNTLKQNAIIEEKVKRIKELETEVEELKLKKEDTINEE